MPAANTPSATATEKKKEDAVVPPARPRRRAAAVRNPAGATGLWPHQAEAVDAIVAAIRGGGRTTVVAACGTGKTRIGAATVARLPGSGRILVVLPTIELLRQTLPVYLSGVTGPAPTVIAMCCDATVSQRQELHDASGEVVVSTSAQLLADTAGSRADVVVFSTYMSLPAVADAHARGLAGWDVTVVDEAHRSAGQAGGPWQIVHDDALIPAARRIYMTATPKISKRRSEDRVSMDDPTVFGTVSYRLTFAKAIELGLLADYRIVVPVVTSDEVHRLAHDRSAQVLLGGRPLPASVLAAQIADAEFAAAITVQAVRATTSTWDECYGAALAFKRDHGHLRIPIDHVTDGGLALGFWWHRQKQYLQKAPAGDARVQALHALGAAHQRRDDAWTANYNTLKALYEQTGTVRPPVRSQPWTWLKTQVTQLKAGKQSAERVALLAAIGIGTENRRDIEWRQTYDLLKQFHEQHGHLDVPADLRAPGGALLVTWIARHATLRRAGRLDDAKIALLDDIGFRWSRQQDDRHTQWETHLQELATFHNAHGHINVPHGALRWWFLRQHQLFDEGILSPDRVEQLAGIDPLWHDLRASLTSYRTRRNLTLTDDSWHQIRPLLPVSQNRAWNAADQRAVLDALLWKVRTRCDWDDIDLPGISPTLVKRWYSDWKKADVWTKIDEAARFRGAGQP